MTEERTWAIRKLCRLGAVRDDASDEALRALYPQYIDVLVPQGVDAARVIAEALELMPPIRSTEAITNAIRADGLTTLGERRDKYMNDHNLSLRTVVRDEEEGAELLVTYIDKVIEHDVSTRARAAVAAFDALVEESDWEMTQLDAMQRGVPIEQVLSERISRLEARLRMLER